MTVTRDILAEKILAFLNRQTDEETLAVWAENAMLEGEYEETYFDVIADALAEIGAMNVQGFELPVGKLLNILSDLGYATIFGLVPRSTNAKDRNYV